jgi:hypothetical protein
MVVVSAGSTAPLDIITVCTADHWAENVLPRFAAFVDRHCSGPVRRHVRLVTGPDISATREERLTGTLRDAGWHTVLAGPLHEPMTGKRLLAFDSLRAGLLSELGLDEALYMDPDTDVVADLQGVQSMAPDADMLWVANPLLLEPVLDDLVKHGFSSAQSRGRPVLMECGFMYLRRDFTADFAHVRHRHPDVNGFVPGSTYWNMVMLSLGEKAVRLPDEYNRTFWDVPAAAATAKTVHFTGQWKHLQPYIEYNRADRRIVVHADRVRPEAVSMLRPPDAIAIAGLFTDDDPPAHETLSRIAALERGDRAFRYHFCCGSASAPVLEDFIRGRRGRFRLHEADSRARVRSSGTSHDVAMARAAGWNGLVEDVLQDSADPSREWTVFLEGGIVFDDDLLDRIGAALAGDPSPDSIGMITCYTQSGSAEAFRAHRAVGRAETAERPDTGHYAGTRTLRDVHHRCHHPRCIFARCRRCRGHGAPESDDALVPTETRVVDVAAAFGGLAVVPTQLLCDRRIRWTAYQPSSSRDEEQSEHVVFCDRLRNVSGKRVVILQDVDCVHLL